MFLRVKRNKKIAINGKVYSSGQSGNFTESEIKGKEHYFIYDFTRRVSCSKCGNKISTNEVKPTVLYCSFCEARVPLAGTDINKIDLENFEEEDYSTCISFKSFFKEEDITIIETDAQPENSISIIEEDDFIIISGANKTDEELEAEDNNCIKEAMEYMIKNKEGLSKNGVPLVYAIKRICPSINNLSASKRDEIFSEITLED